MKALEIAGGPAAGFAGLLLAELGHEVVRVTRPGGGGFEPRPTAVLSETEAAYLHRGKGAVELEIGEPEGRAGLLALVHGAHLSAVKTQLRKIRDVLALVKEK